MLNSTEHENFSASKYENENAFSYLSAEKSSDSAMFTKKEFAIVISNWVRDLLSGQISCSAELSMKISLFNLGTKCIKSSLLLSC